MLNKKFLYGFTAGLFSYKFYSGIKNNIRPMSTKIIRSTLAIREGARGFIDEIKTKAQKQDNMCNIVSKVDKQKNSRTLEEEQRCTLDKMSELKKQLENLSEKVDNF
ncbi:hypothetical protein ACJDU8_22730 [Clostridium sp. WILCCON 0269]|uniref:YtxH domain-containing protein n=1 Tax=Candidatus Clostridium eludens TaxID=3381663 RepID=A0ABW8SRC9_9CLOT